MQVQTCTHVFGQESVLQKEIHAATSLILDVCLCSWGIKNTITFKQTFWLQEFRHTVLPSTSISYPRLRKHLALFGVAAVEAVRTHLNVQTAGNQKHVGV